MNTTQSDAFPIIVPKDKVLYFGVKAVVKGDFCLNTPIFTHTHGFKVFLFIEDGVYKISLLKRVDTSDTLKIKEIQNEQYFIFLTPEEESYNKYIQLLQHIEAIGSFNYGIRKILYHDTLELSWYIGGKVFDDLERISNAKQQFKQPKPKILSQSNLSSIVLLEREMPEAIIPYNFYREGMNYFRNCEYRLAYLHFYMILEYCFIKGNNYSEKNQIAEYEQNTDVEFAVLDTIKLLKEQDKDKFHWLTSTVRGRFQEFTLKNILKLLFRYRGEVAHGTKKCGEYSFDDTELSEITKFIHLVCLTICGNMQVYCKSFTSCKDTRLPQRVEELKKDLASIFDVTNGR